MPKRKWGFIGASTIAKEWMAAAVRAQPGHEICCVLSADKGRGETFAREQGIPRAYDSLDDMLAREELDAVYISTTNERHCDECGRAAAAGLHVVCEKPLALTLDDAVAMVRTCHANGVVMATNHHLRAAVAHQTIRALIADGAIGDFLAVRVFHAVYLPSPLQGWRLNRADAGGGVILDIAVHNADTVAFILNAYPQEVVAMSQNAGMGVGLEDGCMSIWRFAGGGLCYAHESFAVRHAGNGLEVHGSKGSIIADNVMTQHGAGRVLLRNADGEREIPLAHHNLYAHAMSRFAAAMDGDGVPMASGEDGVRSLAVALALRQSAASGGVVAVDYGGFAVGESA